MTMIVHRDNRNKKKNVMLVLLALGVIYGVFFSPVAPYFSGAVHTAAVPLWKAGDSIASTFKPFAFFSSRREVYLENKDLKTQVDVLSAKLVDRSLLREENKKLKELLGREGESSRVLGVVLSRPARTPYDTLVVDVGEKHGVSKGDRVVLESVLLGEVSEVYYSSSKVTLFSTAGNAIQVIVGTEGIPAEAVGKGGGVYEITLPRESEVYVGDTVYLSNLEPLVLGVVDTIEEDPNDAFETIHVMSAINPYTISFVEVVL
jgi:rod shape-determining protein MreC